MINNVKVFKNVQKRKLHENENKNYPVHLDQEMFLVFVS